METEYLKLLLDLRKISTILRSSPYVCTNDIKESRKLPDEKRVIVNEPVVNSENSDDYNKEIHNYLYKIIDQYLPTLEELFRK